MRNIYNHIMNNLEFYVPMSILRIIVSVFGFLIYSVFGFLIYKEESRWCRLEYKIPAYEVRIEYTKMTTDEIEFVMTQIQRDMLKEFK